MDANMLLTVLSKGTEYTKNQQLIKVAESLVQEFKTTDNKQQLYTNICRLQELLLKNALKKRLYVQQKRRGELSHQKAQEKEKFYKGKKAMTLPELTREFESVFAALTKPPKPVFPPISADFSLFRDAGAEKDTKYPWESLQKMLKESIRFLLEFVCEGKEQNAILTDFLDEELSFDRQSQDTKQSLDYHSSASIVQTLTHAIHAYHKYEIFQSGYDMIPATEMLKQAAISAFECCEFAYMHYIYMRTKDLVQMKLKPSTELDIVNQFRSQSGRNKYMDICEKRQEFEKMHRDFVDNHGAPEHDVDLDLIQDGWHLYIQAKHFNEAPASADDLRKYTKEIVRLVKFAVLNGATAQELEAFLAEEETAGAELDAVTQFSDPAWEEFFDLCNRFEGGYHYVLIAPEKLDSPHLNSLFRIPWDLIIDFDPATENGGLMDLYRVEKEKPPVSRDPGKVIDPFVTISEPHWIRANGVYDNAESICTSHREWKKRYGKHLSAMIQAFHSTYTGFIKLIYLPGHDPETLEYLIERIDEVFTDDLGKRIPDFEHVLMDNHDLADDFDDSAILCGNITLEQMLQGCAHSGTARYQVMSHHLPGMEPGAQVRKEYALDDFCEPLYDSIGTDSSDIGEDVRDFYRGARQISWRELALRKDLQRDIYHSQLYPQLLKLMQESEQALYTITYAPGLGGTTFLRRIAWDMHKDYPTLIIHRYIAGCDKRLQALRSQITDGRRMLLLIDSNDMSYQDATMLYRALKSQNSRFVMIYLHRRGNAAEGQETGFLTLKELDPSTEIPQMIEKLQSTELDPRCNAKLIQIRDRGILHKEDRTPFYLSMYAFDKDFAGFQSYVAHFLNEPMQKQYRNFLAYIALHDLVASGPALDTEFFKYHMDGVRTREEAQEQLCRYSAFQNLVVFQKEKKILTCRYRYYGIARSMLCQLTNNDPNAETINYLRLASYVTDFIRGTCVRGRNENLIDFLKRLLIDRDEIISDKYQNQDPEENSPAIRYYEERERFSPLIQQIGCEGNNTRQWTPNGRAAVRLVFATLAECYPDNPHFIAHYARFLSEKDGDYTKALEILNRALNMGGDNFDSTLLHMKGMVFSRLAEATIENIRILSRGRLDTEEYMEKLRIQVEEAQTVFANFEKRGIRGVAGLLSDCKLCIRVIEMGMSIEQLDADLFLLNHPNDWYHELADRACSLFESCEKYKEEIYGEDQRSYFSVQQSIHRLENGSRNSIKYYEEHLQELDRAYRPIMRRHLVRAYMDGICYTDATEKDKQAYWHRIRQLTEENILEDPNNPANYRQWFRAAINTRDENADQLMLEALQKVNDWLAIDESGPDVQLYRYILNFLQAVDGSTQAEQNMEYYRREMQKYCGNFTEKTSTRYWLGPGRGLQRLVVLSGEEIRKNDEIRRQLQPLTGRLHQYRNERNASIKSYNAEVFFMPQQSNGLVFEEHFDSRLEVVFYLGFSYDGPRAHNATVELKTKQKALDDDLQTGDIVNSTVLEQRRDYLLLDIREFGQKAKLYFADLLKPFSEQNLPAVMTDLDIELIHPISIRDNDTTQTGWLAKMYCDDSNPKQ